MIRFDRWWFPDGETHLQEWMTKVNDRRDGRLRYQGYKYDAALSYVRHRGTAVDVGAHVGLFSYWLARDFDLVVAFEPHPDHLACWIENMRGAENVRLLDCVLGDRTGSVSLTTGPSSSGDTYVTPGGESGTINIFPLDAFKSLQALDFLKCDCEGGEYAVIKGAEQTIKRWWPVILIEQKPGHGEKYGISDTAGADLLQAWGYKVQQTISGDVILTKG